MKNMISNVMIKAEGKINMKSLVAVILILAMAFSSVFLLASCGSKGGSGEGKTETEEGSPSGGDSEDAKSGDSEEMLDDAIKAASEYIVENVEVESIGGMGVGWAPLALKRSGSDAADDDYYQAYYDSVRALAKSKKGILDTENATPYERVSMNLIAMGEDPTNVEGYDIMSFVDRYKFVCQQGLNAEMYALISSQMTGYALKNEKRYLRDIVKSQNKDGSFGLDKKHPDVDMTAMAVQALSFYADEEAGKNDEAGAKGDDAEKKASRNLKLGKRYKVDAVIKKAVSWMASQQEENAGYPSCESTAQVMIALGMLGRDPLTEEAFIKEDKTLLDGLFVYKMEKGFFHAVDENVEPEEDVMATEQALMAMDSVKLAKEGGKLFS